jgi:HTH-type transcriptional regulator/antitoxin HipB
VACPDYSHIAHGKYSAKICQSLFFHITGSGKYIASSSDCTIMDYAIQLPTQLREHLRALRKERGLTQTALGRLLGVGQARIAEIENNPGVVSIDQLMRVLSALQTSLILRDEVARSERHTAAKRGSDRVTQRPPTASLAPLTPLAPHAVKGLPMDQWQPHPLTDENRQAPTATATAVVIGGDSLEGAMSPVGEQVHGSPGPGAEIAPTPWRSFIARPKKGSW